MRAGALDPPLRLNFEPVALDPRVARSRANVLRATADLLIESGSAGVTIEGIAERSGVAKTTIYRHWKSRSRLVFDAFESLFQGVKPAVPTGPIREQLETILNGLIRGLTSSEWAPAVTALIDSGDRDPELRQLIHDFLAERMEPGREALRSAIGRGELRPDLDVDVAVGALVGPIFYRRLVSREALDEGVVAGVVELFMRGASAQSN